MKKSLEIKKTYADIDRKIRGLACNGLRLIGQGWQVTAMRENFLLESKKKENPRQHKEIITGESVKKSHGSTGGPAVIRECLPNESVTRTQGTT